MYVRMRGRLGMSQSEKSSKKQIIYFLFIYFSNIAKSVERLQVLIFF